MLSFDGKKLTKNKNSEYYYQLKFYKKDPMR